MFDRDLNLFIDYLVTERGLSSNTTAAYRSDLEEFRDWLTERGFKEWSQVDREAILDYLDAERDLGRETATLARRLVAVKMLSRFLTEEGILKKDVTAVMDSPKLWRILPDFLSEAEVDAFLKAFPASVKEPFEMRNRAILEVLYSSGLRVSELARLPLTAVDFDNELLRVVGKGSKTRIVPIGKVALRTLRRYLADVRPLLAEKNPRSPYVFLSKSGRPLNREWIWNVVKVAAAAPASIKISTRTRCATPSPATCSPTAPTCASFRKCWAMPTSAPPKSTPTSTPTASPQSITNSIRAAEKRQAGS